MPTATCQFRDWLKSLPLAYGFPAASEIRHFFHEEADYDECHLVTGDPSLGNGMIALLKH